MSFRDRPPKSAGTKLAAIHSPAPTCAPDIAAPPRPPAETLYQSAANLPWSGSPAGHRRSLPNTCAAWFPGSAQCRPPAPAPTLAPTATACIPSPSQFPPPSSPNQDSSENSLPESADCCADNHPLADLRTDEIVQSEIRAPRDCRQQIRFPARGAWRRSHARDRPSTTSIPSAAPQSDALSRLVAGFVPRPRKAPDTAPFPLL